MPFKDDHVAAYRCGAAALGAALIIVLQDFNADLLAVLVGE